MRHRVGKKKLGRGGAHRTALMRNLLTSLVEHEAIETTHSRCKALKREVDKLITLGKRGTLNARRVAATRLYTPRAVQKLFDELAPRFEGRAGGYCRIIQRGHRRGDAAPVSIIEFLREEESLAVATGSVEDEAAVEE